MLSKKLILWTLTLLVIGAIGTAAILRYQHHRDQHKKSASAQAKKDKKEKVKSDPDKEPSDEPAPAPKMESTPIVIGPAAREHLAEQSFISALREAFLWRSSQPENPETNRVLLEKLSAITCEDLPPDRKNAWQALLQVWKSLGNPARANDPELKAQGQRAAETLNAMFKTHGDGDIVL